MRKIHIDLYFLSVSVFLFGLFFSHSLEAKGIKSINPVFCDIKRDLAGRNDGVNSYNYKQIIDIFYDSLGCNGIRIYIKSKLKDVDKDVWMKEHYDRLYHDVVRYARNKNMYIYANLLPEDDSLEFGGNTILWSKITSMYANYFCPDFLGPFNENSKFNDHIAVVKSVRSKLKTTCVDPFGNSISKILIVGPDSDSISGFIKTFNKEPELINYFDIISVHNNGGGKNVVGGVSKRDRSMSVDDWLKVKYFVNKPLWASEVASDWDSYPIGGVNAGKNVGMKTIIDSGVVDALVIYTAANLIDKKTFGLNSRGMNISAGIKKSD